MLLPWATARIQNKFQAEPLGGPPSPTLITEGLTGQEKAIWQDTLRTTEKRSNKYRIQITLMNRSFCHTTSHGTIRAGQADRGPLQAYVELLSFELNLYPPQLVERSKLHEIVLCKGLSFDSQKRRAILDFASNTLFLDVSRVAYNPTFLRKCFHHEFYHLVDYRDDGSLEDWQWRSSNNPAFEYGNGGESMKDLMASFCPAVNTSFWGRAMDANRPRVIYFSALWGQ